MHACASGHAQRLQVNSEGIPFPPQVLESKSADRARKQSLARGRKEVLAGYAYPRLDVEVSKKMNHLLKAPFCVHPKTGKVSEGLWTGVCAVALAVHSPEYPASVCVEVLCDLAMLRFASTWFIPHTAGIQLKGT